MPFIALPRLLSPSKLHVVSKDDEPSGATSKSSKKAPPARTFSSKKKKTEVVSSPASKRGARAFFSLFGTLQSRRQLGIGPSHPQVHCHFRETSYPGYDDDEYGECDVEAEEIRRPSGLGRRASMGAQSWTQINTDTDRGDSPYQPEMDDISVSDNDELTEIRCPSGLGHFKPSINVFDAEIPPSTYPLFESKFLYPEQEFDTVSTPESTALTVTTSFPPLSGFSNVVPFLAPYLPQTTLISLTLVDHAVSEASVPLLWKDVTLKVALSPPGRGGIKLVGHKHLALLESLSKRHELASLVRSVELLCHSSSSAHNPPVRRRPPPLLLRPSSAGNRPTTPPTPGQTYYSHSAPLFPRGSVTPHGSTAGGVSPKYEDVDKSRSSRSSRRGSAIFLSGLNLKPSLPPVNLLPTSVNLARPFSALKRRSLSLGTNSSQPQPDSPDPTDDNTRISSPVQPRPPGSSSWTPPPEWEWTPSSSIPQSASVPRVLSPSPSPTSSPSQSPNGWKSTSTTSHHPATRPFLRHSLSAPKSDSPKPTLQITTSPSLSLLRPHNSPSPTAPGLMVNSTASDGHLVSPATTPCSSLETPFSALSLSSFPLPPTCTPPSTGPSRLVSSYASGNGRNYASPPPEAAAMPSHDDEQLKMLELAFNNLDQLTDLTLAFCPASPTSTSDTKSAESSSDWRIIGVEGVNISTPHFEALLDLISRLTSLQRLRVQCPAGQENVHRTRWSVLKSKFNNSLEIEVVSASQLAI